jgi:LEA14-like dessication related protein
MSYTYESMKEMISMVQKRLKMRRGLVWLAISACMVLTGCELPKEQIVLKQIRDVVVDATTDPLLKANAIFYNPNDARGKLKKIKVDIFINGKKAGEIDQDLKTLIPAKSNFTVPIEVKLALKEFGVLDTIFSMLGGKKFEVHYQGSLRLTYHGVPIRVPVDYKDEIRLKF